MFDEAGFIPRPPEEPEERFDFNSLLLLPEPKATWSWQIFLIGAVIYVALRFFI